MRLRMEGYRSPLMDSGAFGPPDPAGVRLAEIRPSPGWSARIGVYEGEPENRGRALEGIVLSFDGEPTPPSRSDGFLYVEADREPSRIGVVTAGWELVDRTSWQEWGSVLASQQTFTVEDGRLTVHLRAR